MGDWIQEPFSAEATPPVNREDAPGYGLRADLKYDMAEVAKVAEVLPFLPFLPQQKNTRHAMPE